MKAAELGNSNGRAGVDALAGPRSGSFSPVPLSSISNSCCGGWNKLDLIPALVFPFFFPPRLYALVF